MGPILSNMIKALYIYSPCMEIFLTRMPKLLHEKRLLATLSTKFKPFGHNITGFTFTYLQNDISLLQLDQDVRFSRSFRPACLPYPFKDVPDFTKLTPEPTIVGWGAATFGGGTVSAQKEVMCKLLKHVDRNTKE